MPDSDTTSANSNVLRDCFSAELLKRIVTVEAKKPTKRHSGRSRKKLSSTKPTSAHGQDDSVSGRAEEPHVQDAEELADFIDYLSQELFDALPKELQALSYSAIQADTSLANRVEASHYAADLLPTLPTSISESLTAYALLSASTSAQNLLTATLHAYIQSTTAAPPVPSSTKASVAGCEICGRDWMPLTYHHLIPKSTHDRVRKRGWHEEHVLNSVAWLCRACHSYVHSVESNESLAKDYFTVDRLVERDDVRKWATWVGRVRWKAR